LSAIGSWGVALAIWGLSGVAALCGALSWAELAGRLPRQGGTYIFIREGIGEAPAFLYITSRVLLLNPCSQAVQGLAAAQYLAAPLSPCSPPPQAQQLLAIALTLLMTALHCGSTKATVKLNTAITGVKLAALLSIIVAGLVTLGIGNSPRLEVITKSKAISPVGIFWSFELTVRLCRCHLRRLLGLCRMAGNPFWD